MSEIRINMYQVVKSSFIPEKSTGFFSTVLKALHSGLNGVIVVFFWIVRLWPVWLIYVILRLILKLRNKDKA
jgi:hypothetical protein